MVIDQSTPHREDYKIFTEDGSPINLSSFDTETFEGSMPSVPARTLTSISPDGSRKVYVRADKTKTSVAKFVIPGAYITYRGSRV